MSYDPTLDVWTLDSSCKIANTEDLIAWQRDVFKLFAPFEKQKVYLLIDISNFELSPHMADKYGPIARAVTERTTALVIRYGKKTGFVTNAIQIQGRAKNYRTHVVPDRPAALTLLAKLRAEKK